MTALDAALEAPPAELARLSRACAALIGADHDLRSDRDGPDPGTALADPNALWLADLVESLAAGHVSWLDTDGPDEPLNPDTGGLRELLIQTARATVVQALAKCVAVQRRAVVGVFGSAEDGAWTGYEDPLGPLRYVAMPEPVLEALFHHARLHDNLDLAAEAETLQLAEEWRAVAIPGIERHYRELGTIGAAAATTTTGGLLADD